MTFDALRAFSQGAILEFGSRKTHNFPVTIRFRTSAYFLATAAVLIAGTAFAAQTTSNYSIPLDVIDAGGSDVSKSSNYLLSDSVGEPIVGYGSTSNYILNSGYRQPSAAEFLSLACSSSVEIGSVVSTGLKTGSGMCIVYSDAYSGYNLGWAVLSGSGGVNTGSLVNQFNDTIGPFTPAIVNTPETWSVLATDSEWGARLRSLSTDTRGEWGTDTSSEKWLNIRTSNRTIVTRSSSTPLQGSTEIIQFRAEVGSSKLQPTGLYQTRVTFTLVGY